MDKMLTIVYRLLWLSLNLIATIYLTLRWLGFRLQAATLWSYDLCRSRISVESREHEFLVSCKAELTKRPLHLNIVVGPDNKQFSEEALSRIISYAFIMDIKFISFYDTRCLSSGRKHVSIAKIAIPKGVHLKELGECHYRWTKTSNTANIHEGFSSIKNDCNDYTDKTLEIYEISTHDGRPLISNLCRKLFERRGTSELQEVLKDRSLLTECINGLLLQCQCLGAFPEPELSIVFNLHTCTFGVLPWQTRFTEFHTHELGLPINGDTFAKVLCRYSRCEQRWGK